MATFTVITITCNRLDLTKQYLPQLKKRAGVSFKHIVVDNGSSDGTVDYLRKCGYVDLVISLKKNYGILKAWQIGIKEAFNRYPSDYYIKLDNDCNIQCDNILVKIADFYRKGCKSCIVAPIDTEILPNEFPQKFAERKERGYNCLYVGHTGGIFQVLPEKAAKMLITEKNDKLIGGDLLRGRYWIKNGFDMIYLLDLKIEHKGIGKQTKNYKLA